MARVVRFTENGRNFDVPVEEAAILADELALGSGDKAQPDVTDASGALAAVVRDVIASGREPDNELTLGASSPPCSSRRSL